MSRVSPSRRSATARAAATRALLLRGGGRLGGGAGRDRAGELLAGRGEVRGDAASCCRTAAASRSSASGSRPGRAGLGQRGGQVPPALGGQGGQPAHPLLRAGQAVAGVLGRRRPRGLGRRDLLERGQLGPRLRERRLDLVAALAQPLLVAVVGGERAAQGHDVVGEQAQPRVALVGLHLRRPAGRLGLAAERLELAAKLGGEVGEPGEVALHRLELAQGLLLALLVLEDAGSLLDEGPAVLRSRRQHGVELALPDDDVQLAADPAVAEQLLHVDQAAAVAVDGVLRLARCGT